MGHFKRIGNSFKKKTIWRKLLFCVFVFANSVSNYFKLFFISRKRVLPPTWLCFEKQCRRKSRKSGYSFVRWFRSNLFWQEEGFRFPSEIFAPNCQSADRGQSDQMSLWKKSPRKYSPTSFCNYALLLPWKKSCPKFWDTSVIFKTTAHCKQTPNRRKFRQIWSPWSGSRSKCAACEFL
jgi:hypothetical protein